MARAELMSGGEGVGGLLICDGTTVELQQRLRDDGLGLVTLTELGYRRHLYRAGHPVVEFDPDLATDLTSHTHVAADLPPCGPSAATPSSS